MTKILLFASCAKKSLPPNCGTSLHMRSLKVIKVINLTVKDQSS